MLLFYFINFPSYSCATDIFCDLARYLLVNPDRLDLGLAGDRVDQVHDLPVLAEDPLLNPRNSARRHSPLGGASLYWGVPKSDKVLKQPGPW